MTEQKTEDQSLEQRLMNLHNELVTIRLADAEKTLKDDIHKVVEAKRALVAEALRKGFGLTADPIITGSKNLAELGRKIALLKADTGKRTPAKEGDKGPEGSLKPNVIDKMFEDARKGEKT